MLVTVWVVVHSNNLHCFDLEGYLKMFWMDSGNANNQ